MRLKATLMVIAILLAAAPSWAQKKQKDPVLESYLLAEFAKLNSKLDAITDRMAAAEAELAKLKAAQAELLGEIRSTQTTAKTTDTALSSFRLSAQQDLLGLKTDMAQLRQDLSRLSDAVKGTAAPPAPVPAPAEASAVEGYITTSPENNEVNVSLGSSSGVKIGTQFDVYKATDPKTQVGILEVVQVIDSNNSRAKVVSLRPSVKLEFSDVVRPKS